MRFLALIYGQEGAWEALSDEEKRAVYARYDAFAQEAGDKIVGGAETAGNNSATTVRVRDGETSVSDGPYAETREQLGGFFVFECESEEEAIAIAGKIPGLERGGTVSLQPAYEEEAA